MLHEAYLIILSKLRLFFCIKQPNVYISLETSQTTLLKKQFLTFNTLTLGLKLEFAIKQSKCKIKILLT